MKTKTKMPKAMYGKTMMKKGGVKKMQKGGMSTSDKALIRAKASGIKAGETLFGTGAYRTAAQENILKNDANLAKNRANAAKVEANKRKVAANKDKVAINKIKTSAKKAGVSYKTGGMVNPNSSVSKQTVAGSKGVMSGVNPKASASNVASSRGTGGVNTPPSKAVPVAKRGGAVKMQKGGTTPRYSKSVYDSQGKLKTQKQMNKKMQKGGISKSDYDKVNKTGISIKPAKNKLLTPSQISVVNKTGISIPKKKMQKGGMIKRK
jgi:hypothetical protein